MGDFDPDDDRAVEEWDGRDSSVPGRFWPDSQGNLIEVNWRNIRAGLVPLEALDEDEIARLQLRRADGSFGGGKPRLVPRELADLHARELLGRNTKMLREVLLRATQTFVDVMDDPAASASDRMKAAQYLQDRLLGPAKQVIELKAEVKPWEAAADNIVVLLGEADTVALEPGTGLPLSEGGSDARTE